MSWWTSPGDVLQQHHQWRQGAVPIVSVVVGRDRLESRLAVERWLAQTQRHSVLAPAADLPSAMSAFNAHTGAALEQPTEHLAGARARLPALHWLHPFGEVLPVAMALSQQAPLVDNIVASTTDEVLATLLSGTTPRDTVQVVLTGLVPVHGADQRIFQTIVTARELSPFFRSPYEGLLYYMLESRRDTWRRFTTNQRIPKRHASGSWEVDLVAEASRLVVEIDGDQHHTHVQQDRDTLKQADLEHAGYTVVRIPTRQLAQAPEDAWRLVRHYLELAEDRETS